MLHAGDVAGGRFRLIRPIGSGGMASVWWARHELIGRDVALKLSPALRDDQVVARFIREAKIIGKFQHRNIVGVVDAGELPDEGYLFLALELLRGSPFADRLVPSRPLPPEEVVPVLIEVCCGLSAAHAEGVVHRDIKPENIVMAMVPGEGIVPKIVDFGISQLTDAGDAITVDGQLLGTPSYMSPEQALGKRTIDARADIWAVGVMLYEALSGAQPFRGGNHHAVLRRILETEPAPLPPSVPQRLRKIAARCLEKDPARRYPDAASLRADLTAALDDVGASAPAPIVILSPASVGRRSLETTRPRGALAAPPRLALRALGRLWTSGARAPRWREATTLGSAPRGAPPDAPRRARAITALRIGGAAVLAAAAALSSAALREPTDEEAGSAARESLRPVLAAAFAESGAWRRGAGAPGAAGVDAPRAPHAPAGKARGRGGAMGFASADPGGPEITAAPEDKPPRSQAPRGASRSRITSPGF
ncbi:serine/threonine-protein kinase [Sorangium cellulosum]|uniref:serine/threonine-protein kinase n=1 Tax=Sorangium cellulosum TaxID=56 RepID=UPI00040420B5|nr:serine/threonine-protein kinase [Sorangium cellulosum]